MIKVITNVDVGVLGTTIVVLSAYLKIVFCSDKSLFISKYIMGTIPDSHALLFGVISNDLDRP